jgi:NADPH:quinone reductase-like Zn-dependent oxidoreductase
MRAIWIPRHGGPDVLEVRETPDPEPGAGEVRVRVKAAGLNFAEIMARQGLYPDAPKNPAVVGYEAAGDVDAVGADVNGISVGDRVAVLTRFGGHSDTVVVPAKQAFPMPASMSYEHGAALPVNYLTAYHMLFQIRRVQPGDHVLIHMAAGGVGTAVLQLCRTVDNITTYGTASGSKHDYVREHGCDHAIDYRTEDYVERIHELMGDRGLDLIMDALGGSDWKKGYKLLRSSGQLIAFGWANMTGGEKRSLWRVLGQLIRLPLYSPAGLMETNRSVAGVNMGQMWHEVDMLREQGLALMRLYEEGKIRPHVDKVFRFDEAADAHRYLQQGKNVGKVVLAP